MSLYKLCKDIQISTDGIYIVYCLLFSCFILNLYMYI